MTSEPPSHSPAWIRRLDALHLRARRVGALHRLAIISRILLALAFFPTGLVKLLGRRFTVLDPATSPVGAFFEAMYQSGFYWNLLGLGQVTAAVLLLIPATRTLGALLFLPIMANVTAVTWSVGFDGTRWITLFMLLASMFLVCWDWHRVRSILVPPEDVRVPGPPSLPGVERAGYLLGTGSGLLLLMASRDFAFLGVPAATMGLGGGVVAVGLVLAGWVKSVGAGRDRVGNPSRLSLPLALVLISGFVASAGCSARASATSDPPGPAAVAGSIHLGQVY